MSTLEQTFFNAYKEPDNICRDMLREDHYYDKNGQEIFGISAYIAALESVVPMCGARSPQADSLRRLKRLRHIRNHLGHETAPTDCTQADLDAILLFHRQLLDQTDPLALYYRQAAPARNGSRGSAVYFTDQAAPKTAHSPRAAETGTPVRQEHNKTGLFLLAGVAVLLLIAGLILLIKYL